MAGIDHSRRRFLSLLIGELWASAEDLRGRPQLRLDDLAYLKEEEISVLVLGWRAGVVEVPGTADTDASVTIELDGARHVFVDPDEVAFLAELDGRQSLGQIAGRLERASTRDAVAIREFCRSFALRLVASRICMPVNPVGDRWRRSW